MTIDTLPTQAPPAPRLQRTESEVNSWHHTVPPGTDWREACQRSYWARNYERLRPGDSITIHSSDHRIRFAMLVMNVNVAADPVHLDAVFVPIWPPNLEVPQLAPQRPPRYETRMSPGGTGFNVIDLRTGTFLRENPLPRDVADNLAASLERAHDQTAVEAEALVAEFERSELQRRSERKAARLPGREGDLHIHPTGGGAWEVHGEGCAVVVSGLDSEEAARSVRAALSAPAPQEEEEPTAMAVAMLAARALRPKSTRPRGRPRKAAPAHSPEPPPLAAASQEG